MKSQAIPSVLKVAHLFAFDCTSDPQVRCAGVQLEAVTDATGVNGAADCTTVIGLWRLVPVVELQSP